MMKTVVYLAMIAVSVHSSNVRTKRETVEHVPSTDDGSRVAVAGGKPALIGQYPWIARVEVIKDHSGFACGGTLITDRFVLTAAHCTAHQPPIIHVYLGDYDTSTFPEDCFGGKCIQNVIVNGDKLLVHEEYDNNTIDNDIAMVRLEKSAPLSALIQPISLPPFDVDNGEHAYMRLTLAGWGATQFYIGSNILQTADINLIPHGLCKKTLEEDILITVPIKHLCAGDDKGTNSCEGDSGGPLIMYDNDRNQHYLVGIVSYGIKTCGHSPISAYSNVFKHKEWIEKNMESLLLKSRNAIQ